MRPPRLPPSADVGVCIAILRLARGWSQGDLAQAAGVTNSAISDYERGKVDPQSQTLLKILTAFSAPMHLFDQTRDFLALARLTMLGSSSDPEPDADELPELPPGVAAEISAIASEGARFTARATRMQLGLLALLVHGPTP